MAENNKTLPDIKGTETIANTWRRLLDRDRNASNLFSGSAFTKDQDPLKDIGRPNWRTDLNRLFIFDGTNFVNLFNYLTPQEIQYAVEHPDVPESVKDVKSIIDLIVNRNMLNTVTMPAVSRQHTGTGTSTRFELERYTSNKNTLYVFIDGVKQTTDTYKLSEDGLSVIFNQAPHTGETIEILQLASLLEYDYSPYIKKYTIQSGVTEFNLGFSILNKDSLLITYDGKILGDNDWEILSDGSTVKVTTSLTAGKELVIRSIFRTSYVTASANSIGTEELKDGSVTIDKISSDFSLGTNNISNGSITSSKIANSGVTTNKMDNGAVTTTKIADSSITKEKLSDSLVSYIDSKETDTSDFISKTTGEAQSITSTLNVNGGTESNHNNPAIQTIASIVAGAKNQSSWSGFFTNRICPGDANNLNTAGFFVDTSGRYKLCHLRTTSGTEDSAFMFDAAGGLIAYSGTKGTAYGSKVYNLMDSNNLGTLSFSSLTTTNKTILGAINELRTSLGSIDSVLDTLNGEVI